MDDAEWVFVSGILEECWPGEWTERTGPSYRFMIGEYSFVAVTQAFKVWARSGKAFRPSASELVGMLESDPGRPGWPDVFEAIFGKGSPLWKEDALVRYDEVFHPFIAAFVRSKGVEGLRELRPLDPEWGGARTEQLRKDWLGFEEVAAERVARGLPLATGGRTAQLRQMTPLALLGLDGEQRVLEAADDG